MQLVLSLASDTVSSPEDTPGCGSQHLSRGLPVPPQEQPNDVVSLNTRGDSASPSFLASSSSLSGPERHFPFDTNYVSKPHLTDSIHHSIFFIIPGIFASNITQQHQGEGVSKQRAPPCHLLNPHTLNLRLHTSPAQTCLCEIRCLIVYLGVLVFCVFCACAKGRHTHVEARTACWI